jgi:DNA modification methylase
MAARRKVPAAIEVQRIELEKLRENEHNPRTITKRRMEQLKRTLEADPDMLWARPLIALPDGTVVAGNHRLMAARELGWSDIPVAYADLDEATAIEWALRDNQPYADDDDVRVAQLLHELRERGRNLELTGYSSSDIDGLLRLTSLHREIQPARRIENPKSKVGEIYELGPHRLICGDATDPEISARVMAGERASLLFTSPPYADMREYSGDLDLSPAFLAGFIDAWHDHCEALAVNLGLIIRKHEVVRYWDAYIERAEQCGLKIIAWNVWDRGSSKSLGHNQVTFPTQHEWVIVFAPGKVQGRRIIATSGGKRVQGRASQREKGGEKSIKPAPIHARRPIGSVLRIGVEARPYGDHPAAFPIELPADYMRAITEQGDIVVDPFAGSGTTLIAAEDTDRRAVLAELDPGYCDLIRQRYADHTGNSKFAP